MCFALCCFFNCAVNGLWISTNTLYPAFGKNPHICMHLVRATHSLSCEKYVCLDGLLGSCQLLLGLIYFIIPRSSYFKSVCVSTRWIYAFNYLLKCVADGHNRPVMAVHLSEEQLQHSGAEGLAPGPLYKRIFCLDLHKAIRSAFASNLMMPFFPCAAVYILNTLCVLCPVVLHLS